jgi:hypothetical protein
VTAELEGVVEILLAGREADRELHADVLPRRTAPVEGVAEGPRR